MQIICSTYGRSFHGSWSTQHVVWNNLLSLPLTQDSYLFSKSVDKKMKGSVFCSVPRPEPPAPTGSCSITTDGNHFPIIRQGNHRKMFWTRQSSRETTKTQLHRYSEREMRRARWRGAYARTRSYQILDSRVGVSQQDPALKLC